MSDKIVIAVNIASVNIYNILDENRYTVHTAPKVSVVNNKVNKNFDYYIQDSNFRPFEEYLDGCILNSKRIPKREQMFFINSQGFSTPKYAFMEDYSYDCPSICKNVYEMFGGLADENTQLIIKMDDGARGIGQVLLLYKDLYRFIDLHVLGEVKMSFDADWYQLGGDREIDSEMILKPLNVYHIAFYEKIEVEKEFRLIFNCLGQYDLVEREVNSQATFQANGGGVVNNDAIPDIVLKKFLDFGVLTGLSFGSMDIYLDTDGNYGIFEYCPQFGFKSHNFEDVYNIINNGVSEKIDQLEMKKNFE